ncbi:MAG: DNA repair protein RecN [Chlorobi bacterium]|nr:DNA repair protein RecN [Chlorobiota bacterium]
MITHLSIKNYVLIQLLEIEFGKGLSVITGETGAGKSILLGALGLILGKRADTGVLQNKMEKCIIEGTFEIANYSLKGFFVQYDLDYDATTYLRREINPNGKSRAFINDSPVGLNILKELGSRLIDIHSQHQTITINNAGFQMAVVDGFAGIQKEVAGFSKRFSEYKNLKGKLLALREKEIKAKAEKDYFSFLLNELSEANLQKDEQGKLENELKILNNAEEIKAGLFSSSQILQGEDEGVINQISLVNNTLAALAKFGESFDEIAKRINSCLIELRDISTDISQMEEESGYDPAHIDQISSRLDKIYSLQQKHNVNTTEGLLEIMEELGQKMKYIVSIDSEIEKTNKQLVKSNEGIHRLAAGISTKRKAVFKEIEKEVIRVISFLGLSDARFAIAHKTIDEPDKTGMDEIRFLFNANRGGELSELSKVASGGEISRLMLAIKSLISQKNLLPTILFDEIDSGISGNIADKTGTILSELGVVMQVIAITHLPQIAGKGNAHYLVYKETDGETTTSHIKKMSPDERIFEIAKMISGQDVTSSSVEAARQLLNN